jgi:hypothetical protein
MNDPERLSTADPSPLVRDMIAAGHEEAPDKRLLRRTLLAVGVGSAVIAAGTGAATTTGAGVKAGGTSLALIAAKWLGVGAVGGLLTMGAASGIDALRTRPAESGARAKVAVTAAPAKARTEAARGAAPAEPAPKETAAPRLAPPLSAPLASTAPAREASIAAEVRAIDGARAALATGNTAQALSILDAYERSGGRHELEQEALYLRMEALSRSGNPLARDVAQKLLRLSPDGPHAARARQLSR